MTQNRSASVRITANINHLSSTTLGSTASPMKEVIEFKLMSEPICPSILSLYISTSATRDPVTDIIDTSQNTIIGTRTSFVTFNLAMSLVLLHRARFCCEGVISWSMIQASSVRGSITQQPEPQTQDAGISSWFIFVVESVTIPRHLRFVYNLRPLAGLKLEHAFFDRAPMDIFSCAVYALVEDIVPRQAWHLTVSEV
ncbi:hypothetical protein BO85DRAFT_497745 [Aspergillus piperis CBS 112811]|uniref:Uncharacterized protein n=1 Tax=Aspergillus piperis CBS 112811 TaxID=1448313 RepID=A0A8G1QZ37_9EURO|nr:hypothetical protein BO85DRAFT_497745 [Aspergillus piperis CBS 112811]RAH56222.1 hypothetical protein BO85DRAFT_497745 [Aspergillus piperis CBS 112811]